MPKIVYTAKQGLYQELGEGLEIGGKITIDVDDGLHDTSALDVTRAITFKTSPQTGVSELSGSLLKLQGRAQGLFFHMGGNQYISNNAWYDATADTDGDGNQNGGWRYEKANKAAFRWGFRGGAGAFDLDYAVRSTSERQFVTGSDWLETSGAFGTGLSLTASNGAITVGKKADRSRVRRWNDSGEIMVIQNGANAQFDVSGSVKATSTARSLALAVTGSVEFGCGASDAYFMLPRHDNTSRDALPAEAGMMIYNTQTNEVNFHNGAAWQKVSYTEA